MRNELIYVIDDDADLNKLILTILQTAEYPNVKGFVDPNLAFRESLLNPPDLLITDLMMPVTDGYEICYKFKNSEELKHIPIIIVTALSTSTFLNLARKTDADYYVTKPFVPASILDAVRKVLDNA